MASIFTLETGGFLIKSVGKIDEELATIDIGYDGHRRTTYKALVALVPVTAHPPSYRELIFGIIEVNADGVTNDYRSGLSTKSFLKGGDRLMVLNAISNLARHMVEKSDPDVLVINTIETNLPPKALAKYDGICAAICDTGYTGGRVDGYLGQEQWQLAKI